MTDIVCDLGIGVWCYEYVGAMLLTNVSIVLFDIGSLRLIRCVHIVLLDTTQPLSNDASTKYHDIQTR
jgi:hypothetical protein